MRKIFYPIAFLLLFSACGGDSAKLKRLQAENDSLMIAGTQKNAEFDELLSTLNEVEDGFQQIKDAENYLTVQAQSNTDLSRSAKDRLASDMRMIQEILKNNREQIAKLQKQYDGSRYQSAEMKKTIQRLTSEIESKSAMIASLQEQLAKKNVQIAELSQSVSDLAGTVDELTQETKEQQAQMAKQEKELNTAYYVYGTKKELKEEKILTGGGLFESSKVMSDDFNKDYFTKVDIRNLKDIPLYAKKAKVLSNMPVDSYMLQKGEDGNLNLHINDPKSFWSLSKYLVIQVD